MKVVQVYEASKQRLDDLQGFYTNLLGHLGRFLAPQTLIPWELKLPQTSGPTSDDGIITSSSSSLTTRTMLANHSKGCLLPLLKQMEEWIDEGAKKDTQQPPAIPNYATLLPMGSSSGSSITTRMASSNRPESRSSASTTASAKDRIIQERWVTLQKVLQVVHQETQATWKQHLASIQTSQCLLIALSEALFRHLTTSVHQFCSHFADTCEKRLTEFLHHFDQYEKHQQHLASLKQMDLTRRLTKMTDQHHRLAQNLLVTLRAAMIKPREGKRDQADNFESSRIHDTLTHLEHEHQVVMATCRQHHQQCSMVPMTTMTIAMAPSKTLYLASFAWMNQVQASILQYLLDRPIEEPQLPMASSLGKSDEESYASSNACVNNSSNNNVVQEYGYQLGTGRLKEFLRYHQQGDNKEEDFGFLSGMLRHLWYANQDDWSKTRQLTIRLSEEWQSLTSDVYKLREKQQQLQALHLPDIILTTNQQDLVLAHDGTGASSATMGNRIPELLELEQEARKKQTEAEAKCHLLLTQYGPKLTLLEQQANSLSDSLTQFRTIQERLNEWKLLVREEVTFQSEWNRQCLARSSLLAQEGRQWQLFIEAYAKGWQDAMLLFIGQCLQSARDILHQLFLRETTLYETRKKLFEKECLFMRTLEDAVRQLDVSVADEMSKMQASTEDWIKVGEEGCHRERTRSFELMLLHFATGCKVFLHHLFEAPPNKLSANNNHPLRQGQGPTGKMVSDPYGFQRWLRLLDHYFRLHLASSL